MEIKKNSTANEDEIKEVMEVIENNEFSRYAGSSDKNTKSILDLKSKYTNIELPYWNYLGGKKAREFEAKWSEYFNIDYSIAVNSATSGLMVALLAIGIKPEDEVITTCMTFTATGASIVGVGAIPVFVDVDKDSYCINPKEIEKEITNKTRAIIVVHLAGRTADMDKIMRIAKEYNIKVIEDCAQSPGVLYKGKFTGTIGDIGVFSFQETKNIMTGEGSMITTNNKNLARRCRLIRNHGESVATEKTPIEDLVMGYNFRMTELTAALGIAQLKKLDRNNAYRVANTMILYKELLKLKGLKIKAIPDIKNWVPHFLPIEVDKDRDKKLENLKSLGIPITPGYARLLHRHPAFTKNAFKSRHGDCSVAEDLYDNKFLWIFHIYHPYDIKDMEEYIKCFRETWD